MRARTSATIGVWALGPAPASASIATVSSRFMFFPFGSGIADPRAFASSTPDVYPGAKPNIG